ncbi:MAG: glycosyl hydrolase 53 family protein [Candidatus Fibromonas sp.]|nr:glycosyl hydrolase 53 family protein [Candidatus Fibromonas sp.]
MNKVFRGLLLICFAAGSVWAQNEPFVLGADISWIPEREAGGVRYAHNGQVRDMLDILKEHKFNYIRLRLFVDPTAKISGESESPYSTKGYCGLDSTIKMAKRVKAAGMKFLLDFHYSDTWADPGKQYKPVSWQGLDFTQLTAKVRSYTKETLEKFKDNNVLPDMVQVGNEIVGGMIWPDGRNSNMSNFAKLMNAGIDGVKDVDANIKIMVHTINERNPNGWLTSLRNNGVTRIDVFGLSYYTQWHGQPDSLQRVATAFVANNSSNNIKIAVAEYSGNHRRVNDIIFDLPNNKGFGTFVWEPADWSDGSFGATLFDWKNNRRETNSLISLYPQMSIDYNTDTPMPSSSSRSSPSSSSRGSSLVSSSSVFSSSSSTGTTQIRLSNLAASNKVTQIHNGINLQIKNNASVEIYGLSGNFINRQNFGSGVYSLPLGHLPKGIYIVKTSFGGEKQILQVPVR